MVTFENKLKYEFVPNGANVISYGDIGEKFYITLHGILGVYVPISKFQRKSDVSFEGNDLGIDPDLALFIKSKLGK